MEILKLQSEVENTKLLMVTEKKTTEALITGGRRKHEKSHLLLTVRTLNLKKCCFFNVRDKSLLRDAEETADGPTETAGGRRLCPGTNE